MPRQAYAQDLPSNPKANIVTWAIMLVVTNLGQEDSLLGFVLRQPPKVIKNNLGKDFEDPDTAYHLEAFYLWQVIDDVTIVNLYELCKCGTGILPVTG
jgi:hypothetical protein